MTVRYYVVIWVDHQEADITFLNATEETQILIQSRHSVQRLHHQAHEGSQQGPQVDTEFFARIASALHRTGGTLVAGPGQVKFELEHYLRQHFPELHAEVERADAAGRLDTAQLISRAREHFKLTASSELPTRQ